MRIICLLAFFAALALSKDSESKRIHVMEKFMFYFNYQIETLIGGDRTFAPDCDDCDGDFNKFVRAIITPNNKPFNFAEPPLTKDGMRSQAGVMERPNTRMNAQKRLDNRRLMPSIDKDIPTKDQYAELYRLTNEWAGKAKAKIDALDGDNKEKAEKLWGASRITVDEMKAMRWSGYLNQQLVDGKKQFGQLSQYEKAIPGDRNGGVTTGKEINWTKLRDTPAASDLLSELESWAETRNKNDVETKNHLASDQLVEDLRKCY